MQILNLSFSCLQFYFQVAEMSLYKNMESLYDLLRQSTKTPCACFQILFFFFNMCYVFSLWNFLHIVGWNIRNILTYFISLTLAKNT